MAHRPAVVALAVLLACTPDTGSGPVAGTGGGTGGSTSTGNGASASETTGAPVDPDCPELVHEGDLLMFDPADIEDVPLYTRVNGHASVVGVPGVRDLDRKSVV